MYVKWIQMVKTDGNALQGVYYLLLLTNCVLTSIYSSIENGIKRLIVFIYFDFRELFLLF